MPAGSDNAWASFRVVVSAAWKCRPICDLVHAWQVYRGQASDTTQVPGYSSHNAASVRFLTFSLDRIELTWNLTVRTLI